jgi:hypothetical protein
LIMVGAGTGGRAAALKSTIMRADPARLHAPAQQHRLLTATLSPD